MSLRKLDQRLRGLRARLGAKWSLVLLLMPPALFGVIYSGPRAALVLAVAVAACMAFGILGRVLAGQPFRWLHPGSLISGLLIGLTCSADIPLYMLIVGAAVAEFIGKGVLPGTRNPFNPAVLGRAAIGLLEWFFPPVYGTDADSGATVLFKEAGGHARPELWDAFWGTTPGAIGETSAILLILCGVLLLRYVIVKWQAAVALLVTVPLAVLALPVTPEIVGHAPWVHNPLYYLLGGSTLFTAVYFATDPRTTPNSRLGGILFGLGAGVIGVLGKYYTAIPGFEMAGILVMNLLTPWLDRLAGMRGRTSIPWVDTVSTQDTYAVRSFYVEAPANIYGPKPSLIHAVTPMLERYAGKGGAIQLQRCLGGLERAVLRDEVRQLGLRGCGGGNHPVVAKWEAVLGHPGPRYLIVNALEGEPETFKDRLLMQRHAATVIEGAAIAAWATWAVQVIIVINSQYRECVPLMEKAVDDLRRRHGTELDMEFRILTGPDPELYVCGEESALIAWLEGRRAEPHDRPPYPTEQGLRGQPTLVHNVETLAWLPVLLDERPPQPPRLVSLSGAVAQPGVYEAAPDMTLRQILALGGGLTEGEQLQALHVGGVSGGLLPPECMDLPLSAEALGEAGAMLGSGAIRVISGSDDLGEETVKAMRYFREQSCGLCTPCRVGTQELAFLAERLQAGAVSEMERRRIMALAETLRVASLCGLGRRAPAPLLSQLRHWPTREADTERDADH